MSIKEKHPVLLEHFFNVRVGFSVKQTYPQVFSYLWLEEYYDSVAPTMAT